MDFSFGDLSVEDIRKECILRYLKEARQEGGPEDTHIYITGKTRSGKTTFENLVIGQKAFSQSGRKDSTQTVQLIEFKNGLSFFDLPGIEGNAVRLENINRVCLGLPMIPPAAKDEPIDHIDVNFAALDSDRVVPASYTLADYQASRRFEPHLVFYIIGSSYGIIKTEELYVQHIMQRHQVIFIINEIENTEIKRNSFDIENLLKDIRERSKTQQKLMICPMDCRTGRGLETLFLATEKVLGKSRGGSVSKILWYQFQRTPDIFRKALADQLILAAEWLSRQCPDTPDPDGPVLYQLGAELFHRMKTLRQRLSQLDDDRPIQFPEAAFQEICAQLDESCRFERIEKRSRVEPYEHEGVTRDIEVEYEETVTDYHPYGTAASIRFIALLLLANELSANRAVDHGDLAALRRSLTERKDLIPADNQRMDGFKRYLYRLLHQFFGPMLNKTVLGERTGDIPDYAEEFISSPYIFYFKAGDGFLVSSLGTYLRWRTENAAACYLDDGLNKQRVAANEEHFDITLLQDAALVLWVENSAGERSSSLRIRVYQPASIQFMDLSALNFRIDPISFHNPQFDLSAQINPGGHLRMQQHIRLGSLQRKRIRIEPDLLDDLSTGDIAGYDKWDLHLYHKLKQLTANVPLQFQQIKDQLFKLFKEQK